MIFVGYLVGWLVSWLVRCIVLLVGQVSPSKFRPYICDQQMGLVLEFRVKGLGFRV